MAASAASRVFAVAELYEQILLHVASATTTKIRLSDGHHVYEPNRGLILLHRVDHTTRATIIASTKLQAAKLPWSISDGNQNAPYEPLVWLLHSLGLYERPVQRIYYHSRDAEEPFSVHRPQRTYSTTTPPPEKAYYDKSIPVLHISGMYADVHLQERESFAQTDSSWRHFSYSSEPQPGPVYIEAASPWLGGGRSLLLRKDELATLGEVYDWFKEARGWNGGKEFEHLGKLLPDEYVDLAMVVDYYTLSPWGD